MRYISAIPIIAALSQVSAESAGGLDFSLIYSERPELETAKPNPSPSVNRIAVASSIESRLLAVHSTTRAASSKPHATKKPKTTTKARKPPKKPAGPKKHKPAAPKKHKPASKKKTSVAAKKKHTQHRRQAASTTSPAAPACVSQPIYYSYVPTPNNVTGFIADNNLATTASSALAPVGYTKSFAGAFGSLFANNYLGYYQLSSYNVTACANTCSNFGGCNAYNIYYERDPVVNPGPTCDNPQSAISVRCALWGGSVSVAQAQNIGEWRTNFMVVISGSNGYNLNVPPPAQTNFTGPTALAGAVSVVSGSSYISSTFTAGGYDPSLCASACQAVTSSNRNAAAASSSATSYVPCNFFNSFKVNYNGTLQGTYCRLYADTSVIPSANQYTATNNGVNYDVNYSYGYTLTNPDSGVYVRPTTTSTQTSAATTSTQTSAATTSTQTSATTTSTQTSATTTSSQTAAATTTAASCSSVNSTGTFLDSNNVNYQVLCKSDVPGQGDLVTTPKSAKSFTGCFAICDAFTGCNGFAFAGTTGAGTCYLKNFSTITGNPSSAGAVDLAWIQGTYKGH